MAYSELETDLLPEELKKARLNLIGMSVFVFIVFAFIKFFFWDNFLNDTKETTPIVVFGVFFLFFFGILFYMMRSFILDFIKRKKLILKGTITDKQINVTTHRSSGGGRGSSGKSTTRRTYYLYFDEKKLPVDVGLYGRMSVGTVAEIHYSKYSNTIFYDKILAEAEISKDKIKAIVPDFDMQQNFTSKEKELQLTREDLEYLKKARNRAVKNRLWILLILGWLVIGPLFSGLWILPFILFPFTIWWFMVLRKLIKYVLAYRIEADGGLKIVYSALVLDKFRQTGSTQGFMIQTNNQLISVSESSYELTKVGDLIMVFKGKATNWVFGFMTSDNQFFEVKSEANLNKK